MGDGLFGDGSFFQGFLIMPSRLKINFKVDYILHKTGLVDLIDDRMFKMVGIVL